MRSESGKFIKQMRDEIGLSQRKSAEEIGITQEYIYQIKNCHIPSRHIIKNIINFYKTRSECSLGIKAQLTQAPQKAVVENYEKELMKAVNRKIQRFVVATT